jgi:hypothetical protein
MKAFRMLETMSDARLAALPPEQVRRIWHFCAPRDFRAALQILDRLPVPALSLIAEKEVLHLWRAVCRGSLPEAVNLLPLLPEALRPKAEQEALVQWEEGTPGEFLVFDQAPLNLRRKLTPARVRRVWLTSARRDAHAALHAIGRVPPELASAITVRDILAAVRMPVHRNLGPWTGVAPVWVLAEIPERFHTRDLAGAVAESVAASRQANGYEIDQALSAVAEMSPALRTRIDPADVAAAWKAMQQQYERHMLKLLAVVPENLLVAISPEEVEERWRDRLERSGVEDALDLLSGIPARLRPWAGPDLVRELVRQAQENSASQVVLDLVVSLPPDLRRTIEDSLVPAIVQTMRYHSLREWLNVRAASCRRAGRGTRAFSAEGIDAVLSRLAGMPGAAALHWLQQTNPELLPFASPAAVRFAWRCWLCDSRDGLRNALEWADPGTGEGRLLPESHRLPDVRAEARQATIELLRREPARGLALPARIPEALRPELTHPDIQAAWSDLLRTGEASKALELWQEAPEAIQPVPSQADLGVLLNSSEAEVRLAALRMVAAASALPAAAAGQGQADLEPAAQGPTAPVQADPPARSSRPAR